ncbi:MAG: hypothetical protein AAGD11_02465 [Planctomycetota bacterium]
MSELQSMHGVERADMLIVGYLEGLSTDDELQEFYALLAENENVRAKFSEQAALHGVLTWMHEQRVSHESDFECERTPPPTEIVSQHTTSQYQWLPYAMLAASLVLFAASSLKVNAPKTTEVRGQAQNQLTVAQTGTDESVAHIVRKVDCDWENDRWGIVSSSKIAAGQTLTMSRGLMELQFASGARVTLEAPVSFRVESAMRGVLSHGKLTAQIPNAAHGFTIETPSGETVDLGTEFGLFVGKDGVTETHVFKGEVVVHPTSDQIEESQLSLTDDMAVRVGGEDSQLNSFASVPSRFVRLDFDSDAEPPVPVIDRKLTLWLAADRRIQKDEFGKVAAWGDILSKSNQVAQNAWQVDEPKRPLWVENAIGDKPAVRFGRRTQMITKPLTLGSAQSVAIVFRIDRDLVKKWGVSHHGRQLLNLNGPPHLTLRINEYEQLVSQLHTGAFKNREGKKRYGSAGKTVSKPDLGNKPFVAISVYDPSTQSSRLYMNGIQVDQSRAAKLQPTNSPRSIGSHPHFPNSHFFGDIAELMIYDTGLSNKEAETLSVGLMAKFGIGSSKQVIPEKLGQLSADWEQPK